MRLVIPACLRLTRLAPALFVSLSLLGVPASAGPRVRVANGELEGSVSHDSKIRIFRGIPYAAPPVGHLRWQEPQPMTNWSGVRSAAAFGARCMQGRIYSDMVFRDNGPSEDCLSLNVWTPAAANHLPVMVWIYGGGFSAGASSEPRQDGEHLAHHGVVVVSLNYRLGIFGFFSHPALSKESGHNASGNYGLLDQVAALVWVQQNIAAFGGDPEQVTIFGESAGSFSVSALMASPLTTGLFNKAIGESGAFFSATSSASSLAKSQAADQKFADSIGCESLAALRAKPAAQLLAAALQQKDLRFRPNIDGYFLPEDVYSIYAAGKQKHVPLLAGWNADEGGYRSIFGKEAPTASNYVTRLRVLFGDKADALLKLYPGATDQEAKRSAQDLAGDQFIAYSTWKWIEMQSKTGDAPVYRYRFEDAPPAPVHEKDADSSSRGAYHSSEIEFVFGTLASKDLPWRPGDQNLSEMMSLYWSNFAKAGNPNGSDLPEWPAYTREKSFPVMHLNVEPHPAPDAMRARYELLDSLTSFQPDK